MSNYIQSNQVVTLPDAANSISSADTGKTFIIPAVGLAATNRIITLPTAQLGLKYKFIMSALTGAANTRLVSITGGANSMYDVLLQSGGSISTNAAGSTSVQLLGGVAGAGAGPGDSIEVTCMSGTQWSVLGSSSATAAFAVV